MTSRLAARLSERTNEELARLLSRGRRVGVGIGGESFVLDVDGEPVFAKCVPLTDREMAAERGTANLFDLPLHCQYGIGGPSLNAWRELAANLTVTQAVLDGQTESFPLLHHWRVLPGRTEVAAEHADLEAVTATMGHSPAVRARLAALAQARHRLLLCFEYLPMPLTDWLRTDPVGKASVLERELGRITEFLRKAQLLHLDGHFGNLRTDGRRVCLTDFGLATSPRFELSPAEREFVAAHAGHDADYAAMRLVNWLVTEVCGIAVPPGEPPVARNEFVDRLAAGCRPAGLPAGIAEILARHARAATGMNALYWRLFGGDLGARYGDQSSMSSAATCSGEPTGANASPWATSAPR